MSKRGTTFIQLDALEAVTVRAALAEYVKDIDWFGHSQECAEVRSGAVALHNRINKRLSQAHPFVADVDLGDPA